MPRLYFYPPYTSCTFVLPFSTVFTVEISVDVPPCMPLPLVEIYGHVLSWTLLLSVEISLDVPTRAYVHALPQVSLIVLPCFCLSVHVLLRASMHVPPLESVLMMDVLRVCLLLCPTDSPSSSVMRVTALGVGKVSGYILGGGSLVIVGVGGDGAAGVAVTRLVVV